MTVSRVDSTFILQQYAQVSYDLFSLDTSTTAIYRLFDFQDNWLRIIIAIDNLHYIFQVLSMNSNICFVARSFDFVL